MKRTSPHEATEKKQSGDIVHRSKRARTHQLNKAGFEADLNVTPEDSRLTHNQSTLEQSDLQRIAKLPKEVGVMLIAAGIVGVILPGPGTPALIAGGLALWPGAFSKLELWLEQHHPVAHSRSMKQIGRFLNDLEKRYPYS